jgi:hypothetical protein
MARWGEVDSVVVMCRPDDSAGLDTKQECHGVSEASRTQNIMQDRVSLQLVGIDQISSRSQAVRDSLITSEILNTINVFSMQNQTSGVGPGNEHEGHVRNTSCSQGSQYAAHIV